MIRIQAGTERACASSAIWSIHSFLGWCTLDEPMRNEAGKIEPYPANFYPTLHRYRMGEPVYIASWSGGKDSTASIILAHEHGEPLDLIIFSEVMFDRETSGELPEHID